MKFDPVAICRILSEHGVKFVVLGGFAAVVHGSPVPTEDIDVIPSREVENLERLAGALQEMNAAIRTSDGPVQTRIDAGFIASMPNMLNLVTDYGDMMWSSTLRVSCLTLNNGVNVPRTRNLSRGWWWLSQHSTTSLRRRPLQID